MAGLVAISVYSLNKQTVDVPHANDKVTVDVGASFKEAIEVFGIRSLKPPATIGVMNSSGTDYAVALSVRNSAVTTFAIDNYVNASYGKEFRVT